MGKHARSLWVLLVSLVLVSGVGCGTEGPAERAGKAIDSAVDTTGEAVVEGAEAVEGAAKTALEKAKEAGEAIEQAAEKAAEKVKEATE